jgi:hypothetical protein
VLTEHIPEAANGFKIIFSPRPFPGYTARFVWTRAEYRGNWYRWPERKMEGWLCPGLKVYESGATDRPHYSGNRPHAGWRTMSSSPSSDTPTGQQ